MPEQSEGDGLFTVGFNFPSEKGDEIVNTVMVNES